VLLTITAVRGESGGILGYVSNGLDLSQQMRLQSRVAHAEALANLGEMASVVAHEIRNPLGSIVMAAKQLSLDSLSEPDRATVIRVLKSESQRLNEVLTNFLAYARPRELRLTRSDLNGLVREVFGMIESNEELCRGVRARLELKEGLEPFPMDADQLRQVLWNILLNAIQAMDGEGQLRVSTGYSDGRAFVRVVDSGPGIAVDQIPKIFKPFHTTKQQGTGLGLAIADRVVKAHGGEITVESRPGHGAVFFVSLPVVQG
jgi:two-component system sensor histidine kinase PilS (NtrC family)